MTTPANPAGRRLPRPTGDLDPQVEQLLHLQHRLMQEIRLHNADEWIRNDLTMSQFKLIMLLFERGALHGGALAREMEVSLSTITGLVDRLVAHGLVRREEDPNDRRLVLHRLTNNGEVWVERLMQGSIERSIQLYGRMAPADRAALIQGMEALLAAARPQLTPQPDPHRPE